MDVHSKIDIEFGIPEHGWLPMSFRYQGFELELEISDVPQNPIVQLCDALIQINKGITRPTRIIWHLEPYCYYLQLELVKSRYKIIISESDELDATAKITKEIAGDFDSIVMPLYRGLKRFWSKESKPPHWEQPEPGKIKELTTLIKGRKKGN